MGELSVWPLVISSLIFVLTYVGILSERIHRTIISLVGATAMIILGTWLGFYSDTAAVDAIDFNTIALLLGMMLIVGIMNKTGLFTYLAIRAAKLTKGSPWRLMLALGLFTSVVSMFLDNVTTIIVVAPVTLSIAEVIGMSAVPLLLGEALLSNIGGVATLIGDPPNILIGSAAGLSFNDFIIHLGPIVLVVWLIVQLLLLFIFRKQLHPSPEASEKITHLNEKRALVDPQTAKKMLVVLGMTVLLYVLHDTLNLSPGIVALIGASAGLLWVRPSVHEILNEVHWDILIFFLCLFIIVGGLEAAGALDLIAEGMAGLTGHGMIPAALAILWISAIMSAVVDNIPFTIAMLPIIAGLAARGVNAGPLWWALALGVGFGGNGTPIGSTASVVAVSISERTETPITFRTWIKSGSLSTVASCIVASIALVVAIKLGLL
jgi:Na+/H+ antiporter NhaD/arsenite permease-like protein